MTQIENLFVQNFTQNLALAPLCLRGAFHDCWNGCNGALLLPDEIDRSENVGLAPLQTFLNPFLSQFTCFLGGPEVPVFFGRIDTGVPDPNGLIPAPTLSVQELISAFEPIGFNSSEIVVLSGAHCVGVCEGQPFCPGQNTTFGNHYYVQLLNGELEGKLQTDIDLLQDNSMRSLVQQYANDQQQFFDDFATVFGKYISRIECNQSSNGPCPLESSTTSASSSSSSSNQGVPISSSSISPGQPIETSTVSSATNTFGSPALPSISGSSGIPVETLPLEPPTSVPIQQPLDSNPAFLFPGP
ncbi:Putative L-ascorbate peroxidase 6 [Galdieria sulphuraria]|nr:Putative L-ascorbate peroxidase 6 [Galdieria sulphuraria]